MTLAVAAPGLLLAAAGLVAARPDLGRWALRLALLALALLVAGGAGALASLGPVDPAGQPFAVLALAGVVLALILAEEGDREWPADATTRRQDRPAILVAGAGALLLALTAERDAARAGLALLAAGGALGLAGTSLGLPRRAAGAALAIVGPALAAAALRGAAGPRLDLAPRLDDDPWPAAAVVALGVAPTLLGLPALLARPSPWLAAGLYAAAPGAAALALRVLGAPRLPSGAPLLGAAPTGPADPSTWLCVAGLAGLALGLVWAARARALRGVAAGVAASSGGAVLLAFAVLAAPVAIDVDPVRRALTGLLAAGLLAHGALCALVRTGERELGGDGLERWVGAGPRNPWLASALAAAVAGPAALPPGLGFLALVGLTPGLLAADHGFAALLAGLLLAGLGLVALRLVRVLFFAAPPESPWGPPVQEPLVTSPGLTVLAVGLSALLLVLGLWPPGVIGG